MGIMGDLLFSIRDSVAEAFRSGAAPIARLSLDSLFERLETLPPGVDSGIVWISIAHLPESQDSLIHQLLAAHLVQIGAAQEEVARILAERALKVIRRLVTDAEQGQDLMASYPEALDFAKIGRPPSLSKTSADWGRDLSNPDPLVRAWACVRCLSDPAEGKRQVIALKSLLQVETISGIYKLAEQALRAAESAW